MLHTIDIVEVETAYGNKVKAYSLERVLCDFLVHKNEIDSEDYLKLCNLIFMIRIKM